MRWTGLALSGVLFIGCAPKVSVELVCGAAGELCDNGSTVKGDPLPDPAGSRDPAGSVTPSVPLPAPACGRELHVLGVYEARSDHGGGSHPSGEVTVLIERQGSIVLALSSYEPIHWTVKAAPGVVLEKVILNGYHEQTATAPDGVPVEIFSGVDGWLGAYAYAWPSSEGGSDTPALVDAVENIAGRELSSFHGCYRVTSFTVHDDLQVDADCPVNEGYELDSYVSPSVTKSCDDGPPPP